MEILRAQRKEAAQIFQRKNLTLEEIAKRNGVEVSGLERYFKQRIFEFAEEMKDTRSFSITVLKI